MIKCWITLREQAHLFAIRVSWWECTPEGFYHPQREQYKEGSLERTFTTQSRILFHGYQYILSLSEYAV